MDGAHWRARAEKAEATCRAWLNDCNLLMVQRDAAMAKVRELEDAIGPTWRERAERYREEREVARDRVERAEELLASARATADCRRVDLDAARVREDCLRKALSRIGEYEYTGSVWSGWRMANLFREIALDALRGVQ